MTSPNRSEISYDVTSRDIPISIKPPFELRREIQTGYKVSVRALPPQRPGQQACIRGFSGSLEAWLHDAGGFRVVAILYSPQSHEYKRIQGYWLDTRLNTSLYLLNEPGYKGISWCFLIALIEGYPNLMRLWLCTFEKMMLWPVPPGARAMDTQPPDLLSGYKGPYYSL